MGHKIRKGLACRKIDGLMFIVDAAGERMYELNPVGSLIWEGLASGKSEARIAETVMEEFETDGTTARNDLSDFMAELSAAGLITERV